MMTSKNFFRIALLTLVTGAAVVPAATASPVFAVTYLNPGVQTPTGITTYYEGFNSNGFINGTSNTTNFNGSPITGTFTGGYHIYSADQFGGAGGTGHYLAETPGQTAKLKLSSGANYFGLWFSALDKGNLLRFYNNGTLVYSFDANSFTSGVGACSKSNTYCGNPNAPFKGNDSGEQYSYINFYDQGATFNEIDLTETCCGNFESDNLAVAYITPEPTPQGVNLSPTPEPSSIVLLGSGIAGLAMIVRRRSKRKDDISQLALAS